MIEDNIDSEKVKTFVPTNNPQTINSIGTLIPDEGQTIEISNTRFTRTSTGAIEFESRTVTLLKKLDSQN